MKKRKKGRVQQFTQAKQQKSAMESEQTVFAAEPAGSVRRKKKIRLNKGRILLTVIVVILIAVVGMSVKTVFELRAEQKDLEDENQNLLQQQEALRAELENVNDLEYIEEQARIQLRMIKPGEILYILDQEKNGKDKDGNEEKND